MIRLTPSQARTVHDAARTINRLLQVRERLGTDKHVYNPGAADLDVPIGPAVVLTTLDGEVTRLRAVCAALGVEITDEPEIPS